MSRIGKKTITIPAGVKVSAKGNHIHVEGPKGKLDAIIPEAIELKVSGSEANLVIKTESRQASSLHGLARTLVANMVEGVTTEFQKSLEINGVGYRAEVKGQNINFTLGFSHPVVFELPKTVKAEVEKQTKITLKGQIGRAHV